MIAMLVAVIVAALLNGLTGWRWGGVAFLWTVAVLAQTAYAQSLHSHLGGADPVAKYRARDLNELKMFVQIPFSIRALSFTARVFGLAGFVMALHACVIVP